MAEPQNEKSSGDSSYAAVIAVSITGLAMLAITIWVISMAFHNGGVGNFASIATLILVGLAAFIGIMNMLSLTAHWMNIVDLKQPFGLPEGTVRAILTIAFIVLVGVLTSFLLSNGQRPPFSDKALIVATGIPQSAASVLEQKFSAEGIVTVTKDNPTDTASDKNTVKFYPRVDYRQSDEIAKQILTILSTILAAMIGFYFGAKPGESASPRTEPAQSQKPDERAALLADYNALKAKPPTLDSVAKKLAAVDQTQRASLQNEYDAIKQKLDAADKVLGDPAATLEAVRTNVTAAKAELVKLAALDAKLPR